MRRQLLVTMLAGVVAGSPAAQAASSPQLTDDPGDWVVAAQDVVSGKLSTTVAAGAPRLRGDLRLSAAPSPGLATSYGFYFGSGCLQYGFRYQWAGTAEASEATFVRTDFCNVAGPAALPAEDTYPVTFAVNGTTLTWQTPYVGGIRDRLRIDGFTAAACVQVCGAFVWAGDEQAVTALAGDLAFSDASYVVGSDRKRR